jgi:hypothetical protein
VCSCVYYCSTYDKVVRVEGGGSWSTCATRDDEPRLGGLVCPSRTSERGEEVHSVKEGGGEEGERERERALGPYTTISQPALDIEVDP